MIKIELNLANNQKELINITTGEDLLIKLTDGDEKIIQVVGKFDRYLNHNLRINLKHKEKIMVVVEGLSDKIIFERYIKFKQLEEYYEVHATNGIAKTKVFIEDVLKIDPKRKFIAIWDGDYNNVNSLITKLEQKLEFAKFAVKFENVHVVTLRNNCLEEYYANFIFPKDIITKVQKAEYVASNLKLSSEVFTAFDIEGLLFEKEFTEVIEALKNNQKKLVFNSFAQDIDQKFNWKVLKINDNTYDIEDVLTIEFNEFIEQEQIKRINQGLAKRILIPSNNLREFFIDFSNHTAIGKGMLFANKTNYDHQIKSAINNTNILVIVDNDDLVKAISKIKRNYPNLEILDIRCCFPSGSIPSNLNAKDKIKFIRNHENMKKNVYKKLIENETLKSFLTKGE